MRVLIFSLLIFGQVFAKTLTVDWHCPSIYEGSSSVRQIPEMVRVKVKLKGASFELSPDIFEEKKINFKSLFGSKPKFVPDLSSCVEKFNERFVQSLSNSSTCSSKNCIDSMEKKFKLFINNKELISSSSDLKKLPRFYTGHNFIKESDSHYKKSIKSFCKGNRDDLKTLTSRGFIEYAKNIAANPLARPDTACVDDLKSFFTKQKFVGECSRGSICNQIKSDTAFFENHLSNLDDQRILFISNKSGMQNKTAFREAKSDVQAKAGRFFANLEHYNNGDCTLKKSEDGFGGLYFYDNAVTEALPYIRDNLSKRCTSKFLEQYLIHKYINDDPTTSYYCRKTSCQDIYRAKALFDENVQALLGFIYDGDFNINACINRLGITKSNAREKLEDLLESIEDANACSPLEKGKTKVVTSRNRIGGSFALKRLDDKKLEATVAIDFQGGKAYHPNLAMELFDKTKSCMEQVSPYLKSPTGESLKVKIIDKFQNSERPQSERTQLQTIRIEPENFRSNSGAYAKGIDCETIAHEVLHILGLVDEYHEKSKVIYVNTETGEVIKADEDLDGLKARGIAKEYTRYQCRAIVDSPSIMSSHWEQFSEVAAKQNKCQCTSDDCRYILSLNNKEVTKLYTQNLWHNLNKRKDLCSYKALEGYGRESLGRLDQAPQFKVISSDSTKIVFQHTDLFKQGNDLFANTYQFECGGCASEKECKELEKIRTRVENKKAPKLKGCPAGSSIAESNYLPPDAPIEERADKLDTNTFMFTSTPMNHGGSLLHPAHFARIKHGSCGSKVKKYNECAKYAYKDRNPQDCPDRPAFCSDPSKWLFIDE